MCKTRENEDIEHAGILRNDIFLAVNHGSAWIYNTGYNNFFCSCFILNKMKVAAESTQNWTIFMQNKISTLSIKKSTKY